MFANEVEEDEMGGVGGGGMRMGFEPIGHYHHTSYQGRGRLGGSLSSRFGFAPGWKRQAFEPCSHTKTIFDGNTEQSRVYLKLKNCM